MSAKGTFTYLHLQSEVLLHNTTHARTCMHTRAHAHTDTHRHTHRHTRAIYHYNIMCYIIRRLCAACPALRCRYHTTRHHMMHTTGTQWMMHTTGTQWMEQSQQPWEQSQALCYAGTEVKKSQNVTQVRTPCQSLFTTDMPLSC